MKTRPLMLVVLLVALWLPLTATANTGTPLMWAGLLHLCVGNALIGVAEGLLIAWVFRRPKGRCIALMIVANYFSVWAGWVGLLLPVSAELTWHLYNAWRQFWCLVGIAYVVTLLLEWPFVAACFWRQPQWLKRSVPASLLVQTVSYLLLFGWYWGASGKSLYTRMHIVSASEMKLLADVRLFFIGHKDGRIYEMHSGPASPAVVGQLVSTNRNDRLLFRAVSTNAQQAELCLRRDSDSRPNDAVFEVVAGPFSSTNVFVESADDLRRNLLFAFGPAAVLRQATNSGWAFWSGFWPVEGLYARGAGGERRFHLSWETPVSQWAVRSATHLPGDLVVFQLGEDQVCLLDAPTRRLARIAEGRGPAVALKAAESSPR